MFDNMNPEWRDRWVTALRSGDYNQGVGSLIGEGNTFCCLGVLCNIINPDNWDSNEPKASYAYEYDEDHPEANWDRDVSTAPEDHSEYWDETHSETELPGSLSAYLNIDNDDEQTLIAFNDGVNGVRNPLGVHLTFNEIADIIEFGVLPEKAIA